MIHGADPKRPSDRNPKYSLPGRKSRATRNALSERLCGISSENKSKKCESFTPPNLDPVHLMRYSDFRAVTADSASQSYNENARSGFDEISEFMNL